MSSSASPLPARAERPGPAVSLSESITPGQLARLRDELADEGVPALRGAVDADAVLTELAYALRPRIHERRVPSYGAIVVPGGTAEQWAEAIGVPGQLVDVTAVDPDEVRLFADGLSSWVLRCPGAIDHLVVFDRSIGDERLLVTLQVAAGGTIVQRHPSGQVRVFGPAGVVRHDGITWYHEPPATSWLVALGADAADPVLERLMRCAVHDLGSRGIGATLVWRPSASPEPAHLWDERMPAPPTLSIMEAGQLAAIRHALTQIDGAVVLDEGGRIRHLGVRLVPTPEAEDVVAGLGGMRHTSALRYSHDDPDAVVVVVSEDGPVTVMRRGRVTVRACERECRADEDDDGA